MLYNEVVDALRGAEYGRALAHATDDGPLREALETASLQAISVQSDTRARAAEIFDLDGEDAALKGRAERIAAMHEARERVLAVERAEPEWDAARFWSLLGGSLSLAVHEKTRIADSVQRLESAQIRALFRIFDEELGKWRRLFIEEELDHIRAAVRAGTLCAELEPDELDGAAVRHEAPSIVPFGLAWSLGKGRQVEAARFLACAADSRSLWVRLRCANLVAAAGSESRERLHALVSADDAQTPRSASVLSALGDLLQARLEDYSGAEQAYREAIALDGDDATLWYRLGHLMPKKQARYDEAEVAYREAIACDDGSAVAWNALGNLLQHNLGRYDEAEAAYRGSIARDDRLAVPWHNLGELLTYKLGRNDEAELAYREAIARDDEMPDAWNALGRLLHHTLERYEEAEAAYREAIARDDGLAHPWFNLGGLLIWRLGRDEEAEVAYREAIARDEGYARAWDGLGTVLGRLRRADESEAAYRRATALAPEVSQHWNNLAWQLYLMGRTTEAVAAGRRAVDLDEVCEHAAHTLACALVAESRWADARPHAQRLLGAGEKYLERRWADVLRFFQEAAARGFAEQARVLLADIGMNERWRPIDLALQAVVEGSPAVFGSVAPEVGQAAEMVSGAWALVAGDGTPAD